MRDIKKRIGMKMMLIQKDMEVVEYICERVIVIYIGRIMEIERREEIYERKKNKYKREMI